MVRRHRESLGIAGVEGWRSRSGWQDQLRELHGEGLTTAEIAEATGWTVGTVRTRLSALGLRAHRLPRER